MRQLPQTAEPDRFTDRYEADLHRGIAWSGESREFFAPGRLERPLARRPADESDARGNA